MGNAPDFQKNNNLKMKTDSRTSRIFYQELSKLFYAMAAVDGTIREEELDVLKKIVKKQWYAIEHTLDEYRTDLVYCILITFDWLRENQWNMKNVIAQFSTYKKDHEALFTPAVNALILKTSYAIASAFARRNKSEMVLFSQIEAVLRQKQLPAKS
jgi:hypothetical protein